MNALDYLNQNSLRNYPISDGCSRVSVDGLFTIPNTLIVDLSLSAIGVGSNQYYISKISNFTSNLTIQISSSNGTVFGTFTASLPSTANNFDLQLVNGAGYPDAVGVMTIGSTDDLAALPSGEFYFQFDSTRLLPRCSTTANQGVTRISFIDAQGNNYTLSGNVTITANSNLQFLGNGSGVLMNAGENLGLSKICTTSASTPVATINGVPPDTSGNFQIISSGCIGVEPVQYGVMITDACGAPCLGCTDISTLTDRVNTLESNLFSINTFVNTLQNTISQANTLISYPCTCDP